MNINRMIEDVKSGVNPMRVIEGSMDDPEYTYPKLKGWKFDKSAGALKKPWINGSVLYFRRNKHADMLWVELSGKLDGGLSYHTDSPKVVKKFLDSLGSEPDSIKNEDDMKEYLHKLGFDQTM